MSDELIDYGRGIYAFDAGYVRPALAAIHLVVDGGRAALIDSGTARSVPLAIAALSKLGLGPEAVDYLILTHVHLDHAAGAGAMMQAFPEARLIVHPRGARHMADPTQLSKAVAAVYGAQRARSLYGELQPVPAERILASDLGASLPLGARCLRLFDTPGHARHHLCVHDEESASIFTGDTFGVCYRELDQMQEEGVGEARRFAFPTTSPSQFDPVALHESIDAILARRPAALYPTHYGQMRPTAVLVAGLRRMIDAHVGIAVDAADAGLQREAQIRGELADLLLRELRDFGSTVAVDTALEVMATDLDLNAQGLVCWLDSEQGRQFVGDAQSARARACHQY